MARKPELQPFWRQRWFALHPSKLKNVAADLIRDKQIVRAVNSQTIWNYWNLIVFRGDSASQPGWSKLINGGAEDRKVVSVVTAIRDKQIAPAVKGQSKWIIQTGRKGSSYTGRTKFIDQSCVRARVQNLQQPQTGCLPDQTLDRLHPTAQWQRSLGSSRSKLIDGDISRHKQVACAVKNQTNWTS